MGRTKKLSTIELQSGGFFWFALLAPLAVKVALVVKAVVVAARVAASVAVIAKGLRVGAKLVRAASRVSKINKTVRKVKKLGKTLNKIRKKKSFSLGKHAKHDQVGEILNFSDEALRQADYVLRDAEKEANANLTANGEKPISVAPLIKKYVEPAMKMRLVAPNFKVLWKFHKGTKSKREARKTVKDAKKKFIKSRKPKNQLMGYNDFRWKNLRIKKNKQSPYRSIKPDEAGMNISAPRFPSPQMASQFSSQISPSAITKFQV